MDTGRAPRTSPSVKARRGIASAAAVLRPRSELSREKDVHKYLFAWTDLHHPESLYRHAFPHEDQPLPAPTPSDDTALTAFAQLCALRLNARRAVISLLSGGTEYVLTEATRSMSLQYDSFEDASDAPWIGCCSFPRSDGINDLALGAWRNARGYRFLPEDPQHYYVQGQSEHWCVINDAGNNQDYNDRAFITRSFGTRFFCSIPLRDSKGSAIGALSVLDDKPRYGISAAELLFLEDSADTIVEHLDATIVRAQQQRGQRLIASLGVFNSKQDSIRGWWLGQDNERLRRGGRDQDLEHNRTTQQARVDAEFGIQDNSGYSFASTRRARREDSTEYEQSGGAPFLASPTSEGNMNAENARDTQGIAGHDFGDRSSDRPYSQPEFLTDGVTDTSQARQRTAGKQQQGLLSHKEREASTSIQPVADTARYTYARASNLIREALHVQGVVFVDAKAASASMEYNTTKSNNPTSDLHSDDQTDSNDDSRTASFSDTDGSDGRTAESSRIIAFSTRNRSTLSGARSSSHGFALSESELRGLLKRYPAGKIFNFSESGGLYSSSGEDPSAGSSEDSATRVGHRSRRNKVSEDGLRLGKVMTGAKTIAFLPIRNQESETFSSAVFVWSTTPLRYFEVAEEMTYIAAFTHSLTAELARLQAHASDTAKGTFISSISHELRSPLHGVLAGAELLQETELTPFQREMSLTVTMAGRTLLDTVNNVLDYSKIRGRQPSLSRRRKHRGATRSIDAKIAEEMPVVDLSQLTEDVVETVVSAYRFQQLSKSSLPGGYTTPTGGNRSRGTSLDPKADITVLLNIDKRENWNTNISSGAWTRIITNVLNNSLKYTPSGTVAVSLTTSTSETNPNIELVIQDTGIGMSRQFVSDDLFTPYKQADSNSIGLGLGLSIVKQIVNDLGGRLDVKSEPGKGTRTSVKLAIKTSQRGVDESDDDDISLMKAAAKLKSYNFHGLKQDNSQRNTSPPAYAMLSSVLKTARDWLPGTTTSGSRPEFDSSTTICGIEEVELLRLVKDRPHAFQDIMSELASHNTQIIVFASSIHCLSTSISFEDFDLAPIFVPQPIGPRKLFRAIVLRGASASRRPSNGFSMYDPSNKADRPNVLRGLSYAKTEAAKSHSDPGLRDHVVRHVTNTPTTTSQRQRPILVSTDTHSQDEPYSGSMSPLSPDSMAGIAQKNPQGQPQLTLGLGQSVLLVEDNPINMQLLKAVIERLDLPFESAVNGLEAFNLFSANPSRFCLILTDVSMPVMDGNEATARMREVERKRKLKRTPIVAITGVTSAESRKTSLDSGVDRYLTKPVKMKALRELINDLKG